MPRKVQSKPKRILIKKTASKKSGPKSMRRSTSQKRGKLSPRRNAADSKKVLGKSPLMVCPNCRAFYYDERWHEPRVFDKTTVGGGRLAHELCDVCSAPVRDVGTTVAGFAGEVVLENFMSDADKRELLSLARHVSKAAAALDPTHRITRIADKGASVVIYTSENQLAASIGKHVDRARKGGSLEIVWSEEDKPVRVYWKGKNS